YVTGEKELYDLDQDPAELVNLASNGAYVSLRATLASTLAGLRALPRPDTTIVAGPQGALHARTAAFTYFTQSRRGRYRCRLTRDGVPGAWAPCNGQSTVVGPLADAGYTFQGAG